MAPRKSALRRSTCKKYARRKRTSHAVENAGECSNASPDREIAPPEPPKKKGRGPNIMRKSTDVLEQRPIIWPVGPREFTCDDNLNQIKTAIIRLTLQLMPGPIRSFNAFDDDTKNNIEFLFLKKFRYKEGEDPDHCRDVMKAIANKRYSEELDEARYNCMEKFGRNIQAWKDAVSHWCLNHPNWHGLCDMFFTEDWQVISRQHQANRNSRGCTVHHGGSASSHQHHQMLTNLCKGKEPSKVQLYAHIHCCKIGGKSPVVARIEEAIKDTAGPEDTNENGDGTSIREASTEEICIDVPDLDISTLHFTNTDSQEVYKNVTDMMADPVNSDMDETAMFLSAVGGSSHERVKGLGSMLQDKGQIAATRARTSHIASSISGVEDGVQTMFSQAEVGRMLADRDRRHDDEEAARESKMETYDLYFKELFTRLRLPMPPMQAQPNSSRAEQGVLGNLSTIQAQLNNSGAEQVVAGQLSGFQGLHFPMQPPHGGSFQALLSQAPLRNDEIARGVDEWWGNLPSN